MKKVLLAAAIASLGLSAAHAAPTLYGKLNVSINQVDNNDFKGNDESQVNSNASRLGIKGEEKLTDRVGVVYQAEWAVATDGKDGGSDTDWSARNRFLGLKFKDIGTVKAGSYDSYFKTAAGKYQDIFNDDTNLDITKTMHGEERPKNVVGFETDKNLLVPGLQFNIMAITGENKSSDYTTKERDSFNAVSTSLTYENKDYGFAAAVAGNFGVPGAYNALGLKDIESDAYRITGSYDFTKAGLPGFVLGALYQYAEPSDSPSAAYLTANKLNSSVASLEEKAWVIQATYNILNTPWTVKGQYQSAKSSADNMDDRKIDQYGIGLDYNFNKQTRFYGLVAQQKRDWMNKPGEDDKKTVYGVGMEYNF
ncbi:porin [Acinetobacter stercoris]|uniref:Gram-negative porin n=1 Tax=Acinetobacter stercoris TaxID=2126983 RepID=A0A2U3MZZ7_9GAMM|nr:MULTISPECIES: porin [Acinetobacter]SPL70869.1 Gram-negative porin [Acinetobacter stercoris]